MLVILIPLRREKNPSDDTPHSRETMIPWILRCAQNDKSRMKTHLDLIYPWLAPAINFGLGGKLCRIGRLISLEAGT